MRLDVRPVQKLRQSPQAQAAFGPIIEALFASSADLATTFSSPTRTSTPLGSTGQANTTGRW